ncbi:MAG: response regulator [Aquamicrobium sp.]|nr:response regulator [Aquamicrobium sp.]
MTGFLLAVGIGAVLINWQAGEAKTSARFGAVLGAMSEATDEVIYYALMLDQTRLKAELASQKAERTITLDTGSERRAAPPAGAVSPAAAGADSMEDVQEKLHDAIDRLDLSYRAFGNAAGTEMAVGEAQTGNAAEPPTDLARVLDEIEGLSAPASVTKLWNGANQAGSLKQDVPEIITLANRLDLFADYSLPVAQRVFTRMQTIASERVRPNLDTIMAELRADAIEGYGRLEKILYAVAGVIFLVSVATTLWVFVPMMRNIAKAHDDLHEANASMEAARIKAESADRAKSEFLANMSHEIRTPMNGVLGMAELLVRTNLDSRQRTFADVILKSGNALLTIINDILDFSKIDAGQLSLDPAPFRLGEAIEDVATLVSTRVAEKDLELIVRVDPELPGCVVGDVGRIRQIVTNLVGNGVKFTEKGHVLVDVSGHVDSDTAHITIRVEDTGIGIPDDMLARVFEKFSQVDASSTRRHEGTGLGLAIASRLVDLMGGEMGVSSDFGKGSTFWFTVPLPVHEDLEPVQPVPVDVSGARVLVIDDNRVNREILLEQLRSWHFDCAAAENGEVGLAFLERATQLGARVDCIILDYQMPGINGLEVARRIAANPATWDIPVLLLTSVDQAITGHLTIESGISAHLNKPARASALLETLVTVMQKAKAAPKRHSQRGGLQPVHNFAPKPVVQNADRPIASVRSGGGRQLDILVAEDNEVNQLVFSQILDGLGFAYRIASNGRTAVEMHRTLKPRLILMDVSMPEMNGLEAAAAIRRAEVGIGTRTPIIGVTAHALKDDREMCIEAGMDDYLSKPVSPNKLAAKINAWIGSDAVALSA